MNRRGKKVDSAVTKQHLRPRKPRKVFFSCKFRLIRDVGKMKGRKLFHVRVPPTNHLSSSLSTDFIVCSCSDKTSKNSITNPPPPSDRKTVSFVGREIPHPTCATKCLRSALYDLRLFGSLFLLKRSRTSCSCQLLRHQVKSRHSSEGGACLRSNHRLRRSVPLRVVPAISYDPTTRFSR